MGDFRGQVAVATGGGQGIGRAVAARLADQGARLAIRDRDSDLAERTASASGGAAFAVTVDVADWASVRIALRNTMGTAGVD